MDLLDKFIRNMDKYLDNREKLWSWIYAVNMARFLSKWSAQKLYRTLNEKGMEYFKKDYLIFPEYSDEKEKITAFEFRARPYKNTASAFICQIFARYLNGTLINQEVGFLTKDNFTKELEETLSIETDIEQAFVSFQQEITNNNIDTSEYDSILAKCLLENVYIGDSEIQKFIVEGAGKYVKYGSVKSRCNNIRLEA